MHSKPSSVSCWAQPALTLALALVHSAYARAQSCQSPSDCIALNGPCSQGACIGNQCQRQPINEGQACVTPNPCVTPAVCNAGYCVGLWQLNCCTGNPDCNDHNPCTTDICESNSCVHGNAPAGTLCGSLVNDACTDPDTCDGQGNCQTHDTPDGADCGGPDCLIGRCGATTYRARLLPEGGHIGSEPRGMSFFEGDPDRPVIAGRVIAGSGEDLPAVWSSSASGQYQLLTLPLGGGVSGTTNRVSCGNSGACVAVGSIDTPAQPAAWAYDGTQWNAEPVPLPAGYSGGILFDMRPDRLVGDVGAGNSVDAQGNRKATYWQRDAQGSWSVFQLPDFGIAGRESSASMVVVCPDDKLPPIACDDGARLMAGWAEDGPGVRRPVVWRETAADSGLFLMTVLPLPEGATSAYDEGDTGIHEVGHWLGFFDSTSATVLVLSAGTVQLTDGTIRGVLWRSTDFQSWGPAVLPPLPGSSGSVVGSLDDIVVTPEDTGVLIIVLAGGSSHPAGGTPLIDGMATQWALDADTLAMISGPANVAGLFTGLPSDATVLSWTGETLQSGTWGAVLYAFENRRGSSQPHAFVAFAGPPAGIPAASIWGLLALAIGVLAAGTIMLRRSRGERPATCAR